MLSWLTGGMGKLWAGLGALLAGLLAVLAIFRSGKSAGANEVIVKSKEKEVENVKAARKVDQEVASAPPDARRAKLLDKWSRD